MLDIDALQAPAEDEEIVSSQAFQFQYKAQPATPRTLPGPVVSTPLAAASAASASQLQLQLVSVSQGQSTPLAATPSSEAHSSVASSGQPLLAPTPCGSRTRGANVTCKKCELQYSIAEVDPNRAGCCERCGPTYKALRDKCKASKAANTWWTAKVHQAQVAWYRKQLQVPSGTKRKWDEIMYEEEAAHTLGNDDRKRYRGVPYWKFVSRLTKAGHALTTIDARWKDAIEGRSGVAEFVNGEWLVVMFEGTIHDDVDMTLQSQTIRRLASITDAEQLRDLRSSGARQLEAFAGSMRAPAAIAPPSISPRVDVSAAEHAPRPAPSDTLAAAVIRDVNHRQRDAITRNIPPNEK